MPKAMAAMTTKAPKSGSRSSRTPTSQNHPRHGQKAAPEAAHGVELAHRVVGGVEHGEQLHQLGRLQVDRPQRQPALRAIDRPADMRNQHQHQQHDTAQEQPGRQLLPEAHRHLEGNHAGDQADGQEHRVADQEVGRLVAGELAAFGRGDGRRIDHHQSEQQQEQRRPEQQGIEFGGRRAGHRPPYRGEDLGAAAHRASPRRRTASTNTPARCS